MQRQREELCERVIKGSVAVCAVAGFVYAALGGTNVAVLPAAYIERQGAASIAVAICSFVLAVCFWALAAFLAYARANRAYMGRSFAAALALVMLVVLMTAGVMASGVQAVLGNGFFVGCNVVFGVVALAAAVAAALLEPERARHALSRAKDVSTAGAKHLARPAATHLGASPAPADDATAGEVELTDNDAAGDAAETVAEKTAREDMREPGEKGAGTAAACVPAGASRARAHARRARTLRMRATRRRRR